MRLSVLIVLSVVPVLLVLPVLHVQSILFVLYVLCGLRVGNERFANKTSRGVKPGYIEATSR